MATAYAALQKLTGDGPFVLSAIAPKVREELHAEELIEIRKVGRGGTLLLTEKGRAKLAELAAAPAPVPVRKGRAPAGDGLAEALAAALAPIRAQLDRIEAALAPAPAPPARDVKAQLLATITDLDLTHRYGGLVPIPEIRKALRAIPHEEVTTALEALERDYVIDLNVAQSPTIVGDRQQGIERPGRGLLYYVSRRGG